MYCIDLAHFKASEERWTKEFEYIFNHRKKRKLFRANHLNGYSPKQRKDLHTIRSKKDFNFLKTIPKFIFGKYIALETFNSIEKQIEYRHHIANILRPKLKRLKLPI